jgi:hypothetical protein
MTPPPATATAAGHARALKRGAGSRGPRGPRRVSGPARTPQGRESAAPAASAQQLSFEQVRLGGSVALPAPGVRPRPRPRTAPGPAPYQGVARRLGALVESSWLDRLLRGRVWIAIVGVGLIGLVFMQVSLLKLNSGMGRDVERAALLERQNAAARADVSKLENIDRLQQLAQGAGMVLPNASQVTFLGRDGRKVSAAAEVPSEAEATVSALPQVAGTTGAAGTAAAGATATGTTTTTGTTATGTTATPPASTATPPATPTAAPATNTTTPPVSAQAPATTQTPAATTAGGAANATSQTRSTTGGAAVAGGASPTGG